MRDLISKHMKRMGEREGPTYFKQVKGVVLNLFWRLLGKAEVNEKK